MSCIKNTIIQAYIDGELTPKEVSLIEKHLINCEKCTIKVKERQKLVLRIKEAGNILVGDQHQIPKLIITSKPIKKHLITRQRIIYSISAACILIFIFIMFITKESENINQRTIIYSLVPDVDANRPITKQQMIINVIDFNGNVSQFYIK
jgi:hypothetical protein